MTTKGELRHEIDKLEALRMADLTEHRMVMLFGFAAMKLVEARDKWDAIPTLHRGYHESQLVKADLDRWQEAYDRKLKDFRQYFYVESIL